MIILRKEWTVDGVTYGEVPGTRVARKHFGWYLQGRPGGKALRDRLVRVETPAEQLRLLDDWFRVDRSAA